MQFLHRFRIALALTALMLAAQFMFWLPALTELGDASAAPPQLSIPILYLLFAPLSNLLDFLTFLTVGRAAALIIGLAAGYAAWRYLRGRGRPVRVAEEVKLGLKRALSLVVLAVAAAFLPRPVPRLDVPEQLLVVDYHTHTSASHDGYWSVAAADRWHRRQGFDAWFVTEHNRASPEATAPRQTAPLPGIEVSVYRLHVIGLGGGDSINRTPFVRDARSALGVFPALHAQNRVTILSLPEYWRNYWETLDALVTAGADGLEIVNCAPKALNFSNVWRESAVETALWHRLLVVGASDYHGLGQVTCVWNLVEVSRDSLLPMLRRRPNGLSTNRVVARTLAVTEYPTWLTAIAGPWTIWRTASLPEAAVWLLWIWVIAARQPYRPPPPKPMGPRTIRPGGAVPRR
ncbi:MAG: PHP domain-containing protein [Gemmatimonadales bacterium]